MLRALNNFPPIWVVNLKKSIDRRKYITKHLDELGLDFQLIEAVNGHNLTGKKLSALYNAQDALRRIRREMSPGEIGCSLSHLKIYQKMIDEDVEEVIVLEDDAEINRDFLEILQRKIDFPPDRELLLLFHGGKYNTSFRKRRTIFKQYQIVKFVAPPYGTLGYLIKQSAARKLLTAGYPIQVPADQLTGGWIKTGVNLYGIYPSCIKHLNEFNRDVTTIPGRKLMQQKYYVNPNKNNKMVKRIVHQMQDYWYRNIMIQYKRCHSKHII